MKEPLAEFAEKIAFSKVEGVHTCVILFVFVALLSHNDVYVKRAFSAQAAAYLFIHHLFHVLVK